MGRAQRSRKTRAHTAAAHSNAQKKQQQVAEPSSIGAAAVAAAFADADAAEELVPLDNEDSGDDEVDAAAGGAALSRGQRKRLKRRSAFMKKMGLVRRVAQEKEQSSKQQVDGAFADIAELQASLFQSDKEAAAKLHQASNKAASAADGGKKRRLSGKQRQKLAVRELGQLRAVQTHPSFQGDPFAAIQLHLQNTVVKANEAAMAASATAKGKSKGMDVE